MLADLTLHNRTCSAKSPFEKRHVHVALHAASEASHNRLNTTHNFLLATRASSHDPLPSWTGCRSLTRPKLPVPSSVAAGA